MDVGSVGSLWRYPIKSMMGEELNAIAVTERGLLGDRAYALMDRSTGKVASAKNPRKWRNLLEFAATYTKPPRLGEKFPPVQITLPENTIVTTEQSDIDRILSAALGREVTLSTSAPKAPTLEEYWPDVDGLDHRETVTEEEMPAETFFDFAVVHVLTTNTIDRLRELYPEGRFEVRRFRPNIVVEPASDERAFIENSWIGRTLTLGDEVRLSISGPCPRCVMTTLAQGDIPKDVGILRTAAQHNQAHVGVYATVLQSGMVRRDDPVRLQ
ncbi:MAG: MOSC domain-containing protein [Proteobacteria bacterium]|nr:MOSC domain-containing protein [Pseudomonadota bacterium]